MRNPRNDGGDLFHLPDPLPEDIVEIAARYATYGNKIDPNTPVAHIRILLRYIEALEDKIDSLKEKG
jgi:hypothetical protein